MIWIKTKRNHFEQIDQQISSFKRHILRTKEKSSLKLKAYKNFILIMEKIIDYQNRPIKDKSTKLKLEKQIETLAPLTQKRWLYKYTHQL